MTMFAFLERVAQKRKPAAVTAKAGSAGAAEDSVEDAQPRAGGASARLLRTG